MTETCRSLLMRFYYSIKPFLPLNVRWTMRRYHAAGIRKRHAAVWPIYEAAGATPDDWPGWPDGKQFALILTHDVESQGGVDKVRALAELEMKHGFRSSFNFIPEGEYLVPDSLREWLIEKGFEVGVHDFHHDGKLYQSRAGFAAKARRINHYLREWKATGFRSGFMLRELAWLHDLDIDYDCSTFDTDPFEPQPTGAHTIFPYWIPCPEEAAGQSNRKGYVELPYTLPQDSTMFLLLREPDAGIWQQKTAWIVGRGGMALMNVHPDYMDMTGSGDSMTYPLAHYEGFLCWVREQYQAEAWQVLPREISRFVRAHQPVPPEAAAKPPIITPASRCSGIKIWIDLENTPHIPFFRPIIRELRNQGHQVVLTARDGYQTCEMAGFHALDYHKIGRHYGRHLTAKVCGLLVRSGQLLRFARHEKPALALNLGSRSQNLAAKLMGIPVVEIMDYEHTAEPSLLESRWCLTPEVVHAAIYAGNPSTRILTYAGIKEDVYVPDFRPDTSILDLLGLRDAMVVVTVRPAATEAHYHNPAAEALFVRLMERVLASPGVKAVLLPRNKRQERDLRTQYPHWFEGTKVVVPPAVVDGLNLIWHSDLIVSGGGTMNREAAAMGVPVYSVFRGRSGAVDRHLCEQGRLVLIETLADVDHKIRLEPRAKHALPAANRSAALTDILKHLNTIIASLPRNAAETPA
jgi:predicted glycosyltransferase